MGDEKHPLTDYPESVRTDYLRLVASVAASDGSVNNQELAELNSLCQTMELGEKAKASVFSAAHDPSQIPFAEIVERFLNQEIRFTLVTDALFLARADGSMVPDEERAITELASQLKVNNEQVTAMKQYVNAVLQAKAAGSSDGNLKGLGGEVAASLASVGVPIGAVAVSGSVFGLSAAGITSGLAALGLGLGMVPGIGVAVGIGVGSYFAVKWLWKTFVED